MATPKKPGSSRLTKSARPNFHTTKSGKNIKLNNSLNDRLKANRDAKALRKAEMLRDMPKSRLGRIAYRLSPSHLYRYWFSREGAIMALKLTGIGFVAMFVLLLGVFAYFRKDLPNLRDISGNNLGGSIRYFDRTGQTLLWEDFDAVKRIPVHSDEIPQVMKDATVATEDRDFYKHGGFDLKGIMRAGFANVTGGTTKQGGSTITQQLVKVTQGWTQDRSYTRKVKELILSVELERTYSKDEILTGYLNAAPYGNIEYGVEAAARDYFQKSAKELTLDEASFLATIPKSPSYYSPYGPLFDDGGKEDVISRQHHTLNTMHELKLITKEQLEEAKKIDILAKVKSQPAKYGSIKAPYFVLAAKEQLEDKLNDEQTYKRGGWKVTTTLDMNLQNIAEEQVKKGIDRIKRQGGDTTAFTAEDVETGQIVALVGGADFTNPDFGQNNYARLPLPPGSSFKPYDYAALMEHTTNFGAGSVLYDTQGELPGWPCRDKTRPSKTGDNSEKCLWNYDFQYPGPMTLRYALGGSRNVPAVKAMLIAGVDKTIETANKLMSSGDNNAFKYSCYANGVTDFTKANEEQCFASSAIGDGAFLKQDEHVHGLASISRNGVNIPRTYILKIEDASNKKLTEWKPSTGEQVIRPDAAYIVADMMSDPNPSYMRIKPHRYNGKQGQWKFAVKTGTTNDAKDGWMTGFSTKYAAGVWVGYHDRTKAMSGAMEDMTLPIWQGWMNAAHENIAPKERPKPSTVQTLPSYVVRQHIGLYSVEPGPSNDLFPSWYQNKAGTSKRQTIDVISNKLATECTPERAKKTLTTTDASSFSGDKFVAGGGANTDQSDDIHKCEDARPGISISVGSSGGGYNITATVSAGTHPLSGNGDKGGGKINILADDEVIKTFDIGDNLSYATTYSPSGDKTITAQVIDSVLYEATSGSEKVTAKSALSLTQSSNPTHVTFNWTGNTGKVTVYKTDNSKVCGPDNNSCNVLRASLSKGTQVYAKDEAGATTGQLIVDY